jgi:hypothetical protein
MTAPVPPLAVERDQITRTGSDRVNRARAEEQSGHRGEIRELFLNELRDARESDRKLPVADLRFRVRGSSRVQLLLKRLIGSIGSGSFFGLNRELGQRFKLSSFRNSPLIGGR